MTKQPNAGMTPAKFLRMAVFKITQAEVGAALGVSQVMVSKLERLPSVPDLYRAKFRTLAKRAKVALEDGWFDAVPLTRSAKGATK
jgi:transcriptional regulator with XRE-family HTH domain